MAKTRKNKNKDSGHGKHWGYHLIINAGLCDPIALRSKATITAFAKRLVKDIDMVAFGEPRVVMFGAGEKRGYTLVQLIETSCISGHFAEDQNDIYLDIFSCKPFDKTIALSLFRETFHPTNLDSTYLKRQARH
jgi:S-adenosylmethionine/arginine decarboxylase-like enzyme